MTGISLEGAVEGRIVIEAAKLRNICRTPSFGEQFAGEDDAADADVILYRHAGFGAENMAKIIFAQEKFGSNLVKAYGMSYISVYIRLYIVHEPALIGKLCYFGRRYCTDSDN